MSAAASMVLALLLPGPPSSPGAGPVIISAPPPPGAATPASEPEVWIELADLPEGVVTGDPEFIETDAPDGGVDPPEDETPRLPAVPATPPTRTRRPQQPSPAPPAALARDLDPAVTTLGCLAFAPDTGTAACVEGGATRQAGGRAVLTLLGQPDEPYELWTVRPAADGGQTIPGDPLEVESARARLEALGARPLGEPVRLDGPDRVFLAAAAPAWLAWQVRGPRTGTTGAMGATAGRHVVVLSCGARRARLFSATATAGAQSVRAWVLGGDRFLLADFRSSHGPDEADGRSGRAVLVDLHRLCRRGAFARP